MKLAIRVGPFVMGLVLSLGAGAATADVVIVVSARNPVTELTKNRVADIFLGKTNQFPDGEKAVPIDQVDGSPSRDEFYEKVSGRSPAQIRAYWSKRMFTGRGQPPQEFENGQALLKRIAQDPHAIGYVERNEVDSTVRVIPMR